MDCSIVATRHAGLFSLSTTDFFYPNIEDPRAQGAIAAANVLSDAYANGVVDVDTVLMLLSVSSDMPPAAADIVTKALIQGFTSAVHAAGASVTGGQTVINPWTIIGGVATATVSEAELIRPGGAIPGDVLVLTKPLGTQVAVNLWQWRGGGATPASARNWPKVMPAVIGEGEGGAAAVYDAAVASMCRLNRRAARALHKYGAHGATDVTGFGLLGHARNLAQHSTARVAFEIHTLPCLPLTAAVDDAIGRAFKLREGLSAETSGGLLVALPSYDAAEAFCTELASEEGGAPAWIIGRVVEPRVGEVNSARILEDAVIIEA